MHLDRGVQQLVPAGQRHRVMGFRREASKIFFLERPIPPAPSGEGVAGEQLRLALGQQQQPYDDGKERRRQTATGGARHWVTRSALAAATAWR